MKFINTLFVNSLLLCFANCGVIKRSTGNISDFSSYSGISELIQANKATFQGIFKDGPIYSGEGTAYGNATNGGNCLFPKEEYYKDMMYAALNHDQYINDLGCGACALVVSTSNPYKPIRIRVIDQCPECKHGDLDFSDKAYKALTNQSPGRVKITWALIPCDIPVQEYPALVSPGSDIKFQFKTGSSATWTEIQVFNTRYPVAKFEAKVNGNFIELKRRDYNYWSNGAGLGAGPFDFRVTLADGSVIDATGVEFAVQGSDEDNIFASGKQTVSGGTKSSGGNNQSNNNNNNNNNIPQAPTNNPSTQEISPSNAKTIPVIKTKTIPPNLGDNGNNNNIPVKTIPPKTIPTKTIPVNIGNNNNNNGKTIPQNSKVPSAKTIPPEALTTKAVPGSSGNTPSKTIPSVAKTTKALPKSKTIPPKALTTKAIPSSSNNTPSKTIPPVSTPSATSKPNTNTNNNSNKNNPWGNTWGKNNDPWKWNPWGYWGYGNKSKNGGFPNPWGMWGFGNWNWKKGWNKSKSSTNAPTNTPTSDAVASDKSKNNNWWIKNQW